MKSKKYGQHFLNNPYVIDKEIESAALTKDDIVLEIGPGKGILTFKLAEKVKQVIAIEIDTDLYAYLEAHCPSNVRLINDDAASYDFSQLPAFTKVVSNLPYQISSPITFKLLKYPFKKAVLIYQKEFAERMIAKPHSSQYGRLTIGVYYHTICKQLLQISKNCFTPPPKVDSSMIEMIPREKPAFTVEDETFFFELTKNLFSQRRKKIKNIIYKKYGIETQNLPFKDNRVEELTPEQIGSLSDIVYSVINK